MLNQLNPCVLFGVSDVLDVWICGINGHKYSVWLNVQRNGEMPKTKGIKKESVCIIIHTFIPYKYGYVN